jgi:hypothetical protein
MTKANKTIKGQLSEASNESANMHDEVNIYVV